MAKSWKIVACVCVSVSVGDSCFDQFQSGNKNNSEISEAMGTWEHAKLEISNFAQ